MKRCEASEHSVYLLKLKSNKTPTSAYPFKMNKQNNKNLEKIKLKSVSSTTAADLNFQEFENIAHRVINIATSSHALLRVGFLYQQFKTMTPRLIPTSYDYQVRTFLRKFSRLLI